MEEVLASAVSPALNSAEVSARCGARPLIGSLVSHGLAPAPPDPVAAAVVLKVVVRGRGENSLEGGPPPRAGGPPACALSPGGLGDRVRWRWET